MTSRSRSVITSDNAIVTVTSVDPHCRVWAKAEASLWGNSKYHGLDEAVRLSEVYPVRVRRKPGGGWITDRVLTLKLLGSGSHVAIRLFFANGAYEEMDISGIYNLTKLDETATVDITS